MRSKLFGCLLYTSLACLIAGTSVMAEDVPMTEEELFYFEQDYAEDYALETEEEALIVAEEEEYLEEDALIAAEDEEFLEAADADKDFNEAFPDDDFRNYLISNGYTTLDQVKNVEQLNVPETVADLTGIQYFTNLKRLYCSNTELTSLDVSGLTKLENLDCYECKLTSLNVRGCTSLATLDCYSNSLTVLDVSGCTALTILDCDSNLISSLNITGCRNLTNLHCYYNILKDLNLSNCPKLAYLECDGNRLTSVDLSLCPILKDLYEHTKPELLSDGYLLYEKTVSGERISLFTVDPSVKIITVHTHTWDAGKITKAATATATGIKTYTCKICGKQKTEIIPQTEKITISKKPSIKKPSATKNKITVNWKHFKHTSKKARKIWKKIKKVQVQCATDKDFKNIVKTATVSKNKTEKEIKGLQKKTKYYVRVRYFDGTGYSAWSKVKKITTKK